MNLLANAKDKPKKKEKFGIYRLQCENCDKYCIGQTSRNIDIIFKKHIKIKNQVTIKFSIVEYFLETNHNINLVKLLKYVTNNRELNMREAI